MRDGWTLRSGGEIVREDFQAKVWIQLDPPIAWEKPHPKAPQYKAPNDDPRNL